MIDYTTSKPPFQPLRAFKAPWAGAPHEYQVHIVSRTTGANIEVEWCTAAELRALRDEIDALLGDWGVKG